MRLRPQALRYSSQRNLLIHVRANLHRSTSICLALAFRMKSVFVNYMSIKNHPDSKKNIQTSKLGYAIK